MSEQTGDVPLDPDGRVRPIFVTRYPQGEPRLDALVAAFERGDFRRVRLDAKMLLADSPSDEIRKATQDLVRRTTPHPLITVFLAIAMALFLFMTIWAYAT